MPARFEIKNGMLQVGQSFDFPVVYLDHWAIRRFSSDSTLGGRFIAALKASGGSLVISHANLAELTGPTDVKQIDQVADFLESVLPNIFFALFNVEPAIQLENLPRDLSVRLMLPPDIDLLKEVGRQRPDDFQRFSIRNTVRIIAANREELGATWRTSNQNLADRINQVRQDSTFVRKARVFTSHPIGVPTLAVFQELLRPIYLDPTMAIKPSDGGDMQHAVLSISYCDFVLLDGKWEHFHTQMKQRFADLKISIPTAKVFSDRRNGVDRFISALETATPGIPSPRT